MLKENDIFKVHPLAFKGLNSLVILDISHNQLTIAPSIAHVKSTLETLRLSYNHIKFIGDTYFDRCINIRSVELVGNLLTNIPNLRNVTQTLLHLSLNKNELADVSPLYGIPFPKLSAL